jgi:hypothetical protein
VEAASFAIRRIKNDSSAILSSGIDASHISVRILGPRFQEFWQPTAAPGIKRGLSRSGVYESSTELQGSPLRSRVKPAVAAKTTGTTVFAVRRSPKTLDFF